MDPAKLTQPAYLSTTLESLRKKASDERARAAARADADNSPNPSSNPDTSTTASASAAAAAAGMTLEWLPTVRTYCVKNSLLPDANGSAYAGCETAMLSGVPLHGPATEPAFLSGRCLLLQTKLPTASYEFISLRITTPALPT